MPKPRLIAVAVALLLTPVIAWASYEINVVEGCWKTDQWPDCPSEHQPYLGILFAGVVLLIVISATGAAFFAYFLAFAAMGVGALYYHRDAAFSQGWWGGVGFIVFPALPLLLIPSFVKRAKRIERLVSTGAEAVATLLSIEDTGVIINRRPRVRTRLRIEPLNGDAPFEAEKTMTVSKVQIPRVGDRFPVFYDPANPADWAIATGPPDPEAHTRIRALWDRIRRGTAPALTTPIATASDVVSELAVLNARRLRGDIDAEEFVAQSDILLGAMPRRT